MPAVSEYVANVTISQAAALLRDAGKPATGGSDPDAPIVLLTHAKPDGDAFGSVVALAAALRRLGRRVCACFEPPVPEPLLALPGADLAQVRCDHITMPAEPALVVILDTGAWGQVGELRGWIEPHLDRTLIVDHHLSGDIPAAFRLIDATAAATCELLVKVIDELLEGDLRGEARSAADRADAGGCPDLIASALFCGLASDTGWFRFSNTTATTHRLAARLMEAGAHPADLYDRVEQRERPQKLPLMARALTNLRTVAGGAGVVMPLSRADFEQTGALPEDTQRLIDLPQQVAGVDIAAVLSERGTPLNPITSMSFRTKPHRSDGSPPIDAARLASGFGGGGHARAAGAKVQASLEDMLPRVIRAIEAAVNTEGAPA